MIWKIISSTRYKDEFEIILIAKKAEQKINNRQQDNGNVSKIYKDNTFHYFF